MSIINRDVHNKKLHSEITNTPSELISNNKSSQEFKKQSNDDNKKYITKYTHNTFNISDLFWNENLTT